MNRPSGCSAGFGFALALGCAVWLSPRSSRAQPIDVATATGSFTGGGVTLTADDLRRFAKEHAAHRAAVAAESMAPMPADATGDSPDGGDTPVAAGAGPRGGGVGNVLIVECNGAFGYDTIQGAIDAAVDGDVVVVLPNDCTPEGRWFETIDFLGKAIRVQSGNPSDPAVVSTTVLAGDLEDPIIQMHSGEHGDSVVDGFTIVDGKFGIHTDGANPSLMNCHMSGNTFGIGTGLIQASGPISVIHCDFVDNANSHVLSKSAMLFVTDCHFGELLDSESSFIAVSASFPPSSDDFPCGSPMNNLCSSIFNSCVFEGITGRPRVINVHSTLMHDCTFQNCEAENVLVWAFYAELTGCTFEDNSGPCADLKIADISECNFISNTSESLASLTIASGGFSSVRNSSFIDNQNTEWGAAIEISIYGAKVDGCAFVGNVSGQIGAAIKSHSSIWTSLIDDCRFVSNQATYGGAVWMHDASFRSCLFAGNRAAVTGGAIYAFNSTVENCTIIGNLAADFAGGVTGAQISNSILYHNRDADGEGTSAQYVQGATATYCDIQDLTYDFTPGGIPNAEAGNFDAEPMFVDPGSWDDGGTPDDFSDDVFTPGDYHLLAGSPCIDAGDPAFVPDEGATDVDGEPRVMGCRVDIGADELTQNDVTVGDFDGDGAVTVADVPFFVQSTLGSTGAEACVADVNGDGRNDGRDVSVYVALLIAG